MRGSPTGSDVRLLTWNIRNGGGDRLDAVLAVLAGERPDVLALQELRGFDASGGRRMRAFADAIGMVPYLARSVFGQPVAVLARPPSTWTAHCPPRRSPPGTSPPPSACGARSR